MKKILLAILVSFMGLFNVQAEEIAQNVALDNYTKAKGVYYDMAILNCYDLNLRNNASIVNENGTTVDPASFCVNKFGGNGNIVDTGNIESYYKNPNSLGNRLVGSGHNWDNTSLAESLNGNTTFDSKLRNAQAALEAAADNADSAWGGNTYKSAVDDILTSTKTSFNNICDYLDAHQGIRNYIKMIINIVCYGALAAGIILGIMDFVKAIASHEDAALTKAFQSFMKRVIAIALIFLSNVFVTLILNVVQRNEYLDLARENATCVTDSLIKVK